MQLVIDKRQGDDLCIWILVMISTKRGDGRVSKPQFQTYLAIVNYSYYHLLLCTLHKIIPASPCMRNGILKLTTCRGKHNSVRARAASRVHFVRLQDGKLIVWPRVRKVESFVVLEFVRVAAWARTSGEVRATGGDGGIDVGLPIADRSADLDAGLTLEGRDGLDESKEKWERKGVKGWWKRKGYGDKRVRGGERWWM